MIGGLNNGWAVANTTLAHERAGLGSGGGSSSASAAIPGTVGGQLEHACRRLRAGAGQRRLPAVAPRSATPRR